MANQFDQEQRWAKMRKAPKPILQTRVALIVHQPGITEKQLAKFYSLRGKRFDYDAFAKKHNISLDWLSLGTLDLRSHAIVPPHSRRAATAYWTRYR